MIELRRITEKSMSKILALNVSENQKHYIDTGGNKDALAFCYAWTVEGKDVHAHAVYAEDEVVGLMIYLYEMIDFEEEEFHGLPCYGKVACWIDYLMIDEKHQGKGYGKLAFEKLLEDIEKTALEVTEYAMIRYSTDNNVAKNIYSLFGFKELFVLEDGCYALKHLMG